MQIQNDSSKKIKLIKKGFIENQIEIKAKYLLKDRKSRQREKLLLLGFQKSKKELAAKINKAHIHIEELVTEPQELRLKLRSCKGI